MSRTWKARWAQASAQRHGSRMNAIKMPLPPGGRSDYQVLVADGTVLSVTGLILVPLLWLVIQPDPDW